MWKSWILSLFTIWIYDPWAPSCAPNRVIRGASVVSPGFKNWGGGGGEAKFFDQFALFCHIVHIACFAHYVIKRSTKLSLCASERALGKLHILQSQTEDILVPQCKTLAPVRANQFWYFKTCARASEWQASARLKMHTMIPNEAILVVTSLCMQTRMQKNKKHILWSHDEVFF